MYPQKGRIYTLENIFKLTLPDTPFLRIIIDPTLGEFEQDNLASVQDSHITREQLLSIPGIASTSWRYDKTTSEDIPLFTYIARQPWSEFFKAEPYPDTNQWWVTPRAFPRKHPDSY